ncbi:MAG: endolytic transglycosylase MltG, partial [Clostridia bacterium]|nr:endolytic transglycosylase MltG [Clostridia bacterium]
GQIIKFTIPEGYEIRQIIETLVNKGLGTKEKFQDVIDNYPFKHEFLQGVELGKKNRLEGYLFPDTYEVYKYEGEVSVINRMLNNFKSRVLDGANIMERAKDVDMSFEEVLILASIIEREGKDRDELKYVSSVFHNRLNSNSYPRLQSCATIQYILDKRVDRISAKEIAIDNPYNTYKYKGLPPGPISNPGIESLIAAVEPAKSNYYFFVAKSDGTHIFSRTFAQHQKAISQAITQQGTGVVDE